MLYAPDARGIDQGLEWKSITLRLFLFGKALVGDANIYAGAEFEVVESELEEPVKGQYSAAACMWNQLRREFLYAAEQAEASGAAPKKGNLLWRAFWASHQRFFRHMCMAAKVINALIAAL